MTKREYSRAYARARKQGLTLTTRTMREIKKVYKLAGDAVAEVVADVKARQLSDLTLQANEAIQAQLEIGANSIRAKLSDTIPEAIRKSSGYVTRVDKKYINDFLIPGIGRAEINTVFAAVNERVVRSVVNRMFTDGYTLSERIWRIGTHYQNQVSRVIAAGFAQGRDPVKIAKDIQGYIKNGKTHLAKSYGPRLKKGTRQWYKRIHKKIDYRALRLVRSELYMGLQEAGRESGRANPGAEDLYDWILNEHREQWPCSCPDNAAGSPYTFQTVPIYPHPNCMCRIQPRLRDRDQFVEDLKKWASGENVDYLDAWNREYYLPAVNA